MELRKISNLPKVFIYKNGRVERFMTIIHGIPFYCSSGINSGYENTWFPHRGIREYDKWVMKPSHISMPAELVDFYNSNNISKELPLIRFGTLFAMCISASIGGGFWNSEKGIILKNYLNKHHADLFLANVIVEALMKEIQSDALEKKENLFVANRKLIELGSMIIPNDELSRLPELKEIELFFEQPINEKASKALKLLLTHQRVLNENHYQFILKFSDMDQLIHYALETHLFEDQEQFNAIYQLFQEKNDKIGEKDLLEINELKDLIDHFPQVEDDGLLDRHETRDALRKLKRANAIDSDSLALIKHLADNLLLKVCKKLLADNFARHILILLHKNNIINRDNLDLVNKLFINNLLELIVQLNKDNKEDMVLSNDTKIDTDKKIDIYNLLNLIKNKKEPTPSTNIYFNEIEHKKKDPRKLSQFFSENDDPQSKQGPQKKAKYIPH